MVDDSNEDKLSPLQRQAALLAAHGMNQADIARRVNHSKQTINRWFSLSEFQAHVDQLVRRLEAEFLARIRAAYAKAYDRLGEMMEDDDNHTALAAIQIFLKYPGGLLPRVDLSEAEDDDEATAVNPDGVAESPDRSSTPDDSQAPTKVCPLPADDINPEGPDVTGAPERFERRQRSDSKARKGARSQSNENNPASANPGMNGGGAKLQNTTNSTESASPDTDSGSPNSFSEGDPPRPNAKERKGPFDI